MNIIAYQNSSGHNVMFKNLAQVATYTGVLREECSVVDPYIRIQNTGPINANYFYIEEFGRYYFLQDDPVIYKDIIELHLHTDVLYTFKEIALASPCIVAKSSDRYNLYLSDNEYKAQQNPIITTKEFSNGFDWANACYILSLIGSKTS